MTDKTPSSHFRLPNQISASQQSTAPPGLREKISDIVRQDPLFAALAAELAAQKGDLTSATLAYSEAAVYLNDPELAKRAVELALGAGYTEQALQAAQVWVSLEPQNAQAKRTVLLLQLSTNRVEEALPQVKQQLYALRQQELEHPGQVTVNSNKTLLDLMSRIPDKAKAYQTTIGLIGNSAMRCNRITTTLGQFYIYPVLGWGFTVIDKKI